MRELGTVMATAFHAPDKLSSLFPPQIEDTIHKSSRDPDEWDYDEWWTSES
jgi:hypothetical protein